MARIDIIVQAVLCLIVIRPYLLDEFSQRQISCLARENHTYMKRETYVRSAPPCKGDTTEELASVIDNMLRFSLLRAYPLQLWPEERYPSRFFAQCLYKIVKIRICQTAVILTLEGIEGIITIWLRMVP